ncbi:alpha/beta fold hydrolase [uncultured Pseudoteredinibacter sp.]|uniref:alpha/beta hydrolase family protein n=1 Tax=uncultured Pseudoteredinibacter sp. TaxID=1641701 RepID=UPI002632EA10|nr:alpha/beta fold hydrolase [uncultured Pseudoteredinibacter sp.]
MKYTIWISLLLIVLLNSATSMGAVVDVSEFAKLPRFSNPEISPNGRYLAAKMSDGTNSFIVMRDLADPEAKLTRLSDGEYYINWFKWANDERLLLSVRKTREIRDYVVILSTIGSVKRDGTGPIFYKAKPNRRGFYKRNPSLISLMKDDPDHVLLSLDDSPNNWASPIVHKVNLETGVRTRVQDNPNQVSYWLADDWGELRVGGRLEKGKDGKHAEVLFRNEAGSAWDVFEKKNFFDTDRMTPVSMKPDSKDTLLVASEKSSGLDKIDSTPVLREFNLITREYGPEYVDPDLQRIKEDVAFLLDGENFQVVSRSRDKGVLVLKSERGNKPMKYHLYYPKTGQLQYLASQYPELDMLNGSKKQKVVYAARDGYKVPAYLSVPQSTNEAAPTVVLVHGGPHARDFSGYQTLVQMLTSRGIAVFQPQFRGSTGFGSKHREAGMKQWGKLMQDDVADGVSWLLEKGVAEKGSICIMGYSYGGYAAAMGLARDSELFKCGISINGVLDFPLLRRDIRDTALFKGLQRETLNDRDEAEQVSPVHLAENIKAPLLLVHAETDAVADAEHSRRMEKAVKKNGGVVKFIELKGGEHWRSSNAQELATFTEIDKFLGEHLIN